MSLPASADYQLQRDASGRLVLIDAAGERHEGVVPVRAFPISAPEDGIALVDAHVTNWPGSNASKHCPQGWPRLLPTNLRSANSCR